MKINQPLNHLDHMIRQTRIHHIQLSSIADMKANMLLILAPLLIPLSIRYVEIPSFRMASMTMIGFCIITVGCSAYVDMPKLRLKSKEDQQPDYGNRFFNILFFGSFAALDYEDYKQGVEDIMIDHNRAYEVQLRDIYSMGNYLSQKKYLFLRPTYVSFISGIVLSSFIFGIGFPIR